ncbi:phage FluMu protein Com [Bradyrhizobium sp. LB7.1]
MKADSEKKEAEAKLREAASETCQAWNYKMIGFGGPAQPSPTVADALAGAFYYLEVECRRCSTHSIVDLSAVNQVRRKSLRCRHCSESLHGRRSPANVVRLRKENTLEFEPWYPEDER